MTMGLYKFSCALMGHSLDVRAVTGTPDGSILSASRDATAKVWRPNGLNPGYHEAQTLRGHTNFVTCVCYCPPSEEYPNGIILTAGNDKNICGFVSEQEAPLFTLKGHSETVCCLSLGHDPNTFLSASWDKTACVWTNKSKSPVLALQGHEFAVWSVIQISSKHIITGSADKHIKIWLRSSGDCEATLTGHTDCVRGLAKISDHEFLSCANDATVRQWSCTGDCLGVFYGHSNYIYNVAVNLGGSNFASVGEDSSLCLWSGGNLVQSITIPAQSVWSVAFLPNSDIVTGSSDGVVRVFSCNPDRIADADTQKIFDDEIAAMLKVSSQTLGGVKISDLPGKEGLYEPGLSDGQTKLIREGAQVVVYSWSAAQKEWTKIGDVAGANEENSGKTLHEGKEFDFVFSIDIKDGEPPLKLPYNVSEDPWHTAQKFIHKHDLPQVYLEQIANFIISNSKGAQPAVPSAPVQGEYCDPFTGGNRYIPSNSQPAPTPPPSVAPSQGFDPFTGANRYVPQGASSSTPSFKAPESSSKLHFPQKSYLRFDQANLKAIEDKLQDLNRKMAGGPNYVDEGSLEAICKLAGAEGSESSNLPTLMKLLEWPVDVVFPVLDVTRLAVRHPNVNAALCSGEAGEQFMSLLKLFLQPAPGPNQMLALRTLCNMLVHHPGESIITCHSTSLLQQINQFSPPFTKPLEVAIATFLLNLSVLFSNKAELKSSIDSVGNVSSDVLPKLSDKEAIYRCLVAVGTLLSLQTERLPVWAENLWPLVVSMVENDDERIKFCAQQIASLSS